MSTETAVTAPRATLSPAKARNLLWQAGLHGKAKEDAQ